MNQLIKQRINQFNKGEIPKGYKKTDFGIFPSDWITDKTFDDLFDFYGGLGKSRDELGDKGYAYLHYGDLHRDSFNKVSYEQYMQLPKCDVSLKEAEKYKMEDGDVAFLDASEDLEGTSRSVLIDNPDNKPFISGLHIIYGKSKDDSLEKWYKQYITSSANVKKQFQRLAAGFKVYGVNRNTLPKVCIAYPKSKKEQAKIAEILMKWDKAIELYQEQIEALEKLKKAYLSVMFPQKGETTPKYRFKGFTDPWEQRKVGEWGNFYYGHSCPKWSVTEDATTPCIRYGEMYTKFGCKIDRVYSYTNIPKENLKFSKGTEVLVPRVGEDPMDYNHCTWLSLANVAIGEMISVYNTEQNPLFTAIMFNATLKYEFAKRVEGGSVTNLYYEKLLEIPVSFPNIEEQKKIASFFENLDSLITLHQRKQETIIKQRKVLQQYLLNGIVRV